jgi:hypothetical protein
VGGRKPWRERPRCARPKWPCGCPEGSLTPWLSLSPPVLAMVGRAARNAHVVRHRISAFRVHIIRTIWSRNFREMCGMRVPSSRPSRRSFDSGNGPGKRTACDVDLASSLADARTIMLDADGHHDDDPASVLGTVQGSPLRSDRASARPSGLDGACAQMISRRLRDGPRMLSASGTHGTLNESTDDFENDRGCAIALRKRALHPFVELHFL